MPKVIFINRFFFPDFSATAQILTDLVNELSVNNVHVVVVTSRNTYQGKRQDTYSTDLNQNVSVYRVRCTRLGRHGLLGRSVDYLSFYVTATYNLLKIAKKNDILVAKTDPPLIGILAKFVARIKNAKQVNWLQDIFPEIAVKLNMFPRKIGFFTTTKYLRNRSLQHANINVVLGEKMKDFLLDLGVPESKISVIHNWADDNLIRPVLPWANPLRDSWGLSSKFVIGYSGNMGRAHEYETVLDAAERLKDNDDIIFLWIGGGVKSAQMRKEIDKRGIRNFIFKDYQHRDMLANSLNVPDVHLTILSPDLEGLIVPSKFYGIAAAGKPAIFIGSPDGEIARLIDRYNCGMVVRTGDHEGLKSAIEKLQNNSDETRKYGENAREMLVNNFSKRRALRLWLDLINRLSE